MKYFFKKLAAALAVFVVCAGIAAADTYQVKLNSFPSTKRQQVINVVKSYLQCGDSIANNKISSLPAVLMDSSAVTRPQQFFNDLKSAGASVELLQVQPYYDITLTNVTYSRRTQMETALVQCGLSKANATLTFNQVNGGTPKKVAWSLVESTANNYLTKLKNAGGTARKDLQSGKGTTKVLASSGASSSGSSSGSSGSTSSSSGSTSSGSTSSTSRSYQVSLDSTQANNKSGFVNAMREYGPGEAVGYAAFEAYVTKHIYDFVISYSMPEDKYQRMNNYMSSSRFSVKTANGSLSAKDKAIKELQRKGYEDGYNSSSTATADSQLTYYMRISNASGQYQVYYELAFKAGRIDKAIYLGYSAGYSAPYGNVSSLLGKNKYTGDELTAFNASATRAQNDNKTNAGRKSPAKSNPWQ